MSIARIPTILAILAAASCSQTSPTPTPERTPVGEAEAAAQQPAKQAPARKQLGFAPTPEIEKVALPDADEQAAPAPANAPADEGCGCQACDDANEAPAIDTNARVTIAIGSSPTSGPASAPVTIVVFSDFQCPFCARAVDTLEVLQSRYGDELRIAFKNRPLPMHDRAPALARAALAANQQGHFWEFHDALFDGARMHDEVDVEKLATRLGLDVRRFRADVADARIAAQVAADDAEAARLQVKGTPTFFVNGRRITGAQQASVFRDVIDEELRAAGRRVPNGKQ